MKRKIIVFLVLSIFLISSLQSMQSIELTKQEEKDFTQNSPKINLKSDSDTDEWTIMIYMCADNYLQGYAKYDIEKIQAATRFDDSDLVNIIVLFDGYGGGNTSLYKIEGGAKISLDDNGTIIPSSNEVNMGNPQTLTNFCSWTLENFPADHTFLILWGNGNAYRYNAGNWFFRTCVDVNNGVDTLKIFNEMSQSLDQITNNGENKIDIIGFDACMMGLIEVAYEISSYADYMIASQDTEYVYDIDVKYGWEYLTALDNLLKNPSYYANNPDDLCKEFVDDYPEDINFDQISTLSAIKLDEIDALSSKISDLGEHLHEKTIEDRESVYINSIFYAKGPYGGDSNVQTFRYRSKTDPTGNCGWYGDLKHYVNLISNKIENDGIEDTYLIGLKDDINDILKDVIIANNNCSAPNVCGLSINMQTLNCGFTRGDEYSSLLFSVYSWDEFIRQFASEWDNNQWPDEPIVTGDSSVKIGDKFELTVEVSDPDGDGLYLNVYWGINIHDSDAYDKYGPFEDGSTVTVNHTYKQKDFNINDPERCLLIHTEDAWRKWSGTVYHDVTLKKSKAKTTYSHFDEITFRFPFLIELIKRLIR